MSTSNHHSCGIWHDGSAWCWGIGSNGRLGNGDEASQNKPVSVLGEGGGSAWNDWIAITAGNRHSCGIRENGTAWCWGNGIHGRLGNNDTADHSTPVQVQQEGGGAGWEDWVAISASSVPDGWVENNEQGHTCGIRANGSAWCWGQQANGRLGNNQGWGADQLTPIQVQQSGGGAGWEDWVAVSLGLYLTCGIREDGSAWCWGAGNDGRLGNNSTTGAHTPVQVQQSGGGAGWEDWIAISAGIAHSCGTRADGTAWCWGYNENGRLGNNDTASQHTPVQVQQTGGGAGWGDWVTINAGFGYSCGTRANGTAWCWGLGSHGRLGNNDTSDQHTPSLVAGAGGAAWELVKTGREHSCGLRSDGTIWCWGINWFGQHGDGAPMSSVPNNTWCGEPGLPAGAIIYNGDAKFMQYCDGAAWMAIGLDICQRPGVTPGTRCADGSYYIGDSPADGAKVFMTSGAYETSSPWHENPPCYRCGLGDTGATSITDGRANVEALRAYSGDNATAGNLDGFGAAKYCDNLSAHTHDDWYLPAGATSGSSSELYLFWTMVQSEGAVGFLDISGSWYWSSFEANSNSARYQRFSDGAQAWSTKGNSYLVRCVRR